MTDAWAAEKANFLRDQRSPRVNGSRVNETGKDRRHQANTGDIRA